MRGRLRLSALTALLLSVAACTGSDDSAPEATPGTSADGRWIVALGDSYISGEGARWAGNTNAAPRLVDALGPRAYAGGRCHRARTSEVQVGAGWKAANVACSGATTADLGLDKGGQAAALQEFAKKHDVGAVVVSIGGNDFGFGQVVAQCAATFVATVGDPQPRPCRSEPDVRARFTGEQAARIEGRIVGTLRNVATAMERAGYAEDTYRIVVQTYPSPLAPGPKLRYRETLLERGLFGGCPFFTSDATWSNTHALAIINGAVVGAAARADLDNLRTLDLSDALAGHRLCERGVGLFDPEVYDSWRDDGVADDVEWVNRVYTGARPWQVQESLHPNYWGVLAVRSELAELLSD